jgi:hypothetical protein
MLALRADWLAGRMARTTLPGQEFIAGLFCRRAEGRAGWERIVHVRLVRVGSRGLNHKKTGCGEREPKGQGELVHSFSPWIYLVCGDAFDRNHVTTVARRFANKSGAFGRFGLKNVTDQSQVAINRGVEEPHSSV